MTAIADSSAADSQAPIYELEVSLCHASPRIRRRLRVPGNANLGWLHSVIQVAMGWTNSHLHQFRRGDQLFSDPSFEMDSFEGDPPVADERKARLSTVLPSVGDVLEYEYDFGDGWVHAIAVEKILPSAPAEITSALCVDGERACPPEDCGGPAGYDHLLKVLKSPKNKEHASMKEWLGHPFDPEAFDPVETTTFLHRLKWPKVTEGALRKVLMARDLVGKGAR